MEKAYRNTIDELIAKYTLEPQLKDLYVEGRVDKSLFEWFLVRNHYTDVSVLDIECINVPCEVMTKYRLRGGNRDRVIALALEMQQALKKRAKYLLCIADSDFDFLLGRKHTCGYLLYTDYTSLDLYFWLERTIGKLLALVITQKPKSIRKLLYNWSDILQELFFMRAANVKLEWGLHFAKFTRCCKLHQGGVIFEKDEYISRVLSAGGRTRDRKIFVDTCSQLKRKRPKSRKQCIRGLDWLELMGWYVAKHVSRGGNKFRDPSIMRSMIYSASDEKVLAREILFKRLLRQYAR